MTPDEQLNEILNSASAPRRCDVPGCKAPGEFHRQSAMYTRIGKTLTTRALEVYLCAPHCTLDSDGVWRLCGHLIRTRRDFFAFPAVKKTTP